jgi:hypothetical protein
MRLIFTLALLSFFAMNSYAHDTGNCVQVESALERLDCYDGQVILAASQTAPKQDTTMQSSPQYNTAPTQEQTAQTPTVKSTRPKSAFFSRPDRAPTKYAATIQEIDKSKSKVAVTLSNGQIWQIRKNHLVTFRVGDSVVVKEGLVGGHTMRVEGGGGFRVKQLK